MLTIFILVVVRKYRFEILKSSPWLQRRNGIYLLRAEA
jgi:hypothetical protein